MGGGGQWKQEGRSNKSFQRAINQENLDKFLDGSGTSNSNTIRKYILL